MFCKKCGKEIDGNWAVCPNCGEKVAQEKGMDGYKIKKKKPFFKKIWFWFLAVIVIGILVVIFSGGDDTEKKVSSDEAGTSTGESVSDLYKMLEDNDVLPFVVNEKAEQFMKDHENYFPTADYNQIVNDIDLSIEYKHVEKSADSYGDKLMELPELYVITVSEEDLGDGHKFTELETVDANDQYYYILYNGALTDIFREDVIKADILPLGMSNYEITSGGTRNAVVGAGSFIQKIE